MQQYLHFTSLEDAQKIKETEHLLPSSIVQGAIYAVAVGGYPSPGVQLTKLGRVSSRDTAVLFTTQELPDVAFPEEVIWHVDRLPIMVLDILSVEEGLKLLDGSISVDEDDHLLIPVTEKDRRMEREREQGQLREFIKICLTTF